MPSRIGRRASHDLRGGSRDGGGTSARGTPFAGLTPDTGTCAPSAADQPGVVVCDVGTLPAGGGAEVRVTATVTAPAGATLTAVAAAVSATHDPGGQPGVATLASPVIAP